MRNPVRILIVIAAFGAGTLAVAQQVEPASEQEMVQLVNAERVKAGLSPLVVDERLTRIARQHSQLMAAKHGLSHQFPGEPDVRHRVTATGLRFNYSGENVAYDANAASAHRSLMNSPPHRANILRPEFTAIGVGVIRSGDLIYVTEDFAHRLEELSPDQAEAAIVKSFAALRRSNGFPPLPLRHQDGLRELACDMARNDRLETDIARDIQNVRAVVVWTATEPQKLPENLQKLRDTKASGWSLGSCFASSGRYPNPVWWNVAVTYF
jgi:Cysteine-rich secretory protein family